MKTFTVVGESWGDNWFELKPDTCNNRLALLESFRTNCVQVPLNVPLGTKIKFAFQCKKNVVELVDYKEL